MWHKLFKYIINAWYTKACCWNVWQLELDGVPEENDSGTTRKLGLVVNSITNVTTSATGLVARFARDLENGLQAADLSMRLDCFKTAQCTIFFWWEHP